MRRLWLFLLLCLFITPIWAATRTAVASGNWTTNNRWDCNCAPSASDDVVIPAGITITIPSLGVVLNNMANITVTVNGTLNLATAGLTLDSGDQLIIGSGGQVRSSGLGGLVLSGLTPIVVTTGNPINGPAVITGGVLPITLLYFQAKQQADRVVLEWASATEESFDHYLIEKSNDGQKFEELTKVQGVVESHEKRTYETIDPSPFKGRTYYRLISVDLDGRREYFDVVSVDHGRNTLALKAYPNPVAAGEFLKLDANFTTSTSCYVTVRDLSGRVVEQLDLQSLNVQLSTAGLSSGLYTLSVLTTEGVFNQRFEVK